MVGRHFLGFLLSHAATPAFRSARAHAALWPAMAHAIPAGVRQSGSVTPDPAWQPWERSRSVSAASIWACSVRV